jgi:3-hydroxyacyl-CoA dehydrogenase
MFEADARGLDTVLADVQALAATSGPGWDPAPLLIDLVRDGRRFADLPAGRISPA